ncbi:MAG: glutaredoxin family protein [Telluria sp.]
MYAKTAKNLVLYTLILAAGLGIGHYVPKLVQMVKPKYSEGNFAAYYPNANTQVVVYGTATCPFCARTRAYLKERHIAFADVDVNQSDKGRHDFGELGGKAVPVILIGNRKLVGFDPAAIEAALGQLKTTRM